MQTAKCKLRIVFVCVFAFFGSYRASADPFAFDDIEFWIGAGVNRAALVIDWQDGSDAPPALVWGYRWNGAATGAKMLLDVVTADERLFAKFGGTESNPVAVYGLGYDADGDRQFGIDDGTIFDSAGVAVTEPADLATATDSGDYYAEGWYTGFWHYGTAPTDPFDGGTWLDTPLGMAGRQLTDGAWDGWTFTPAFNFEAFATKPQAAPSPFPLGDYDHSGDVDANDYTRWKALYGSTSDLSADGNYDGIVNAADYTVWRNRYDRSTGGSIAPLGAVPEPTTASFAGVLFFTITFYFRRTANKRLWEHLVSESPVSGSFVAGKETEPMTRSQLCCLLFGCNVLLFGTPAVAQFAAEVVLFDAGTTPASGFTSALSALGSPERFTGEGVFPGVVSPFSPPFLKSEIVSIGEAGELTLRLSNYAIPQVGGPEIGVFSNFGLADANYPHGEAGSPAGGFGPPDSAMVEVSENGLDWASLGTFAFDIPTNGYTDLTDPYAASPGSVPSDFQQPFTGSLADFDGLKYVDAGADMRDLLAGSGGGKWLDISASGLAKVGYMRFSVPDDMLATTKLNFELDAVAISHAALGGATVPEPGAVIMAPLTVFLLAQRRKRSWN